MTCRIDCTVVSVINIVPVVTAVGLPDNNLYAEQHCSKCDKYCAGCDLADIRPLSAVVLLRHVAARISLCDI